MSYEVQITNVKVEPYGIKSPGGNALASRSEYLVSFDIAVTGVDYATSVLAKVANNRESNVMTQWGLTGTAGVASFNMIDKITKPSGTLTYTVTTEWGTQKVEKTVSIEVYDYITPRITPTIVRNENEEMVLIYTDLKHTESIGSESNPLSEFYVECVTRDAYIRRIYKTDLLDKTPPVILLGTYELAKAYDFTIYMKDAIDEWSMVVTVPSDRPILDIAADGNTVTFFGVSPETADKETLRIKDVAVFGDTLRIGKRIGPRIELNESTVNIYFDTTIHGDVSINDKSIHELIGGVVGHGYSSTAQSTGTDNSKATNLKCFVGYTEGPRSDFASISADKDMLYINKSGIYNFQLRIGYNGATQYKRFEIAPYLTGVRQAPFASTFGADGGNRTLYAMLNYTLTVAAGDIVHFEIKPTEGAALNVTPADITITVLDYEGKYQ